MCANPTGDRCNTRRGNKLLLGKSVCSPKALLSAILWSSSCLKRHLLSLVFAYRCPLPTGPTSKGCPKLARPSKTNRLVSLFSSGTHRTNARNLFDSISYQLINLLWCAQSNVCIPNGQGFFDKPPRGQLGQRSDTSGHRNFRIRASASFLIIQSIIIKFTDVRKLKSGHISDPDISGSDKHITAAQPSCKAVLYFSYFREACSIINQNLW